MIRLLAKSSLRYHLSHPWLLLLSVIGIGVGVAVVVGIDSANVSARTAFALSAEAVAGRSTHSIRPQGEELDEAIYARLRLAGYRSVVPIVEGYIRLPRGEVVTLLGIDPLADSEVRDVASAADFPDPSRLFSMAGSVVVSERLAIAQAWSLGDTLGVRADGRASMLTIAGVVRPANTYENAAWDRIVVTDVATAQEAFGRFGSLTRIDAVLSDEEAARLERELPAAVRLEQASARTETLSQMTEAFSLNLTALSYLALLVGVFLIYNIVSFSVVQRRAIWGRFRAIGVSRRRITRVILVEALVIGAAGSLLGLFLGGAMAAVLTQLVTRAINDLYFVVSVRDVEVPLGTLLKAGSLGLGCALIAAYAPARAASRASAMSVMRRSDVESRLRARIPLLLAGSAGLAAVGITLLWARTGIPGAYAGLLALVAAFALAVPGALVGLSGLLQLATARAQMPIFRMAVGSISGQLSRTSVATAALAVAMASAVGVGVMVESFRGTVETWLGYALEADVYVQPPGVVARRGGAFMDPKAVEVIRRRPEVEAVYGVRRIRASTQVGEIDLVAIEHGGRSHGTFRFLDTPSEEAWTRFSAGDLFVSEPFSFRFGVGSGDTLTLETIRGNQSYRVAAVYYDYGSDLGAVMIDRGVFMEAFEDSLYAGLSIYVRPGTDPGGFAAELSRATADIQQLAIQANADLKAASLEVFDRTFAVTWVLRILAVIVAVIGIISALAALQLERRWEFGVLRAVGVLPKELGRLIITQSGLMGLFAGMMSVPLGLVLAHALVFVINRRSFGWTLQFDPSPEILIQAVLVSAASALAAAVLPAREAVRQSIRDQMRDG